MAVVKPSTNGVSSIKSLLLNPALTSHYQVIIGPPFSGGSDFTGFVEDVGGEYGINKEKYEQECYEWINNYIIKS